MIKYIAIKVTEDELAIIDNALCRYLHMYQQFTHDICLKEYRTKSGHKPTMTEIRKELTHCKEIENLRGMTLDKTLNVYAQLNNGASNA